MATWNSEQTLLLIELYKELNCGSILSREEHTKTLLLIADKLGKTRPGTTITDVKQKIKTIRSQYAKEKVKVKAYNGYKPKLWCYDILRFLDDIDNKRFYKNKPASRPESPDQNYCDSIPDVDSNHENIGDILQEAYLLDSVDSQTSEPKSRPIGNMVNTAIKYLRKSENHEDENNDFLESRTYPINPLEETPTVQINISSHARNYAFATFICEELNNIQNDEILENAKWAIQTILHNASIKSIKRKE